MSLYAKWITSRERSLTLRDTNRRIMPFDWGLEWLGEEPTGSAPLSALMEYADKAMQNGDFFEVDPMEEYVLKDDLLEFPSPGPNSLPQQQHSLLPSLPGPRIPSSRHCRAPVERQLGEPCRPLQTPPETRDHCSPVVLALP